MIRIFSTLALAVLTAAPVTIFAAHAPRLQPTHELAGTTNLSHEHRRVEMASPAFPAKHKKYKKKMNKQMKKRKHH
jgi:hypothetical protein